jgi:hypothetical protein
VTDDACGGNGEAFGMVADGLGGKLGHAACVSEPLLARAGVGVAGIDDDASEETGAQMLARDGDGRGTDAVEGERAGGHDGDIGDKESEVGSSGYALETTMDGGGPEAFGPGEHTFGMSHGTLAVGKKKRSRHAGTEPSLRRSCD